MQELYKKYRPQNFEDIIGNEQTVQSVQKTVKDNKCPHALLFTGQTGCGKTTIARIIARELGGKGSDVKEIDSASFRGIDTIRQIRKQAQFLPVEGRCKIYICDELHKMTNEAQNALLKILEDTPKHVYFILCTTDPQKLLPTIRGRCSIYQMQLLTDKEMLKLLRRVVVAEDEKIEREVYQQIIQDAQGHPRNALQVLEQVLNVEPDFRLQMAKKKAEEYSEVIQLCRALINGKSWKMVAGILKGLKGQEAESIRRAIIGYAQSVLLNTGNPQAALVLECFIEPFYDSGFPQVVFACFEVVSSNGE